MNAQSNPDYGAIDCFSYGEATLFYCPCSRFLPQYPSRLPDLGLGYRLALIPPMMFVPLLKLLWDVVGNPVERY